MLLRKSTFALCSSGSLSSTFSLPPSTSAITSSTGCPSTISSPSTTTSSVRRHKQRSSLVPNQWLSYATVGSNDNDRPVKPSPSPTEGPDSAPSHLAWPTHPHPTPYQIFNQQRGAPYSKKTFYSLVKLYHPDRHLFSSHPGTLSQSTKLERYRLVVAANTILSDPNKRRAYDRFGAGWNEAGGGDMSSSPSCREMDRAWRRAPGSAAGNATWEDWERWYESQDPNGAGAKRKRQDPLYMSNGLFVGVLAMFVVVGSWGQATRAGNHSVHLIEMRETSSQNISEDMWRRRQEKAVLSREDRVESFLRQREGWGRGEGSEGHLPKD